MEFTEDNSDRAKARELLEDYCELDTLGMVEIVKKLGIVIVLTH